jgi:hypothetical protein
MPEDEIKAEEARKDFMTSLLNASEESSQVLVL